MVRICDCHLSTLLLGTVARNGEKRYLDLYDAPWRRSPGSDFPFQSPRPCLPFTAVQFRTVLLGWHMLALVGRSWRRLIDVGRVVHCTDDPQTSAFQRCDGFSLFIILIVGCTGERPLNGSHLRDIASEEPWFVRKA